MGIFKKGNPGTTVSPAPLKFKSVVERLPENNIDWSDLKNIRNEWASQTEGVDEGMLGWRNGMRLYDQRPVPGQLLNVAEYMTRALGYDILDAPILTEEQTAETVRRVLTMIENMPTEPDWLLEFAPRLARLALAVARNHGWQPHSLGGDGQVELISYINPEGLVWNSVRCPGVAHADVMAHFFREQPLS